MKPHEIVSPLVSRLSNPARPNHMGIDAALRRMNLSEPGNAAVIALRELLEVDSELDVEHMREEDIQCWLLALHMLALARWRHDRSHSVGEGLVAMMLSENRLKQLLSADFEVLRELLPRLARRFSTVSPPPGMNFIPLVDLIFKARRNSEGLHRARLKIARSYALAQYRHAQHSA